MAQHDFNIDNQSAPAFRGDLNNALEALGTLSSGATAPSTTYANMLWYDTATNILKMRSEADDAWINLGTLNQSTNTFAPAGVATQTTATWETGTDTTESLVSAAKVAAAIAANGSSMVLLGTLATTSGSTQVLSGLVLTPYKELHIAFNDIEISAGNFALELNGAALTRDTRSGEFGRIFGFAIISLAHGHGLSAARTQISFTTSKVVDLVESTGIDTATTSLTFGWSGATNFTAGEILVYGVR